MEIKSAFSHDQRLGDLQLPVFYKDLRLHVTHISPILLLLYHLALGSPQAVASHLRTPQRGCLSCVIFDDLVSGSLEIKRNLAFILELHLIRVNLT